MNNEDGMNPYSQEEPINAALLADFELVEVARRPRQHLQEVEACHKSQSLEGMVNLNLTSLAAEEEPKLQEVNHQELLPPQAGTMLEEGGAWVGHSPLAVHPKLTHPEAGGRMKLHSG